MGRAPGIVGAETDVRGLRLNDGCFDEDGDASGPASARDEGECRSASDGAGAVARDSDAVARDVDASAAEGREVCGRIPPLAQPPDAVPLGARARQQHERERKKAEKQARALQRHREAVAAAAAVHGDALSDSSDRDQPLSNRVITL